MRNFEHKPNDRVILGRTEKDIGTTINNYQKKCLKHLNRVPDTQIVKFLRQYKPKGKKC
jgi:hypothetical protein